MPKAVALGLKLNYQNTFYGLHIMLNGKSSDLPAQSLPFPVNPGLHSHTCDPMVFVQLALLWQVWFPLHSSTSIRS